MFNGELNLSELLKRAIKYLVEGLMVAIAAFAIPKKSLNLDEVALIALTAAATFSRGECEQQRRTEATTSEAVALGRSQEN